MAGRAYGTQHKAIPLPFLLHNRPDDNHTGWGWGGGGLKTERKGERLCNRESEESKREREGGEHERELEREGERRD